MPIVAVIEGQKRVLKKFLAAQVLKVWPYKNDRTPKPGDLVGAYTEADFSGYDGLKTLTGWTDPVMVAAHASSSANSVSWRHNGGGVDNLIYGVVWVDEFGVLLFAERDPKAPITVDPDHRGYNYRGTLTDTTEFSP
jgi:hypothetical protein